MTEDEYKTFVDQAYSGALLIGIDRAVARKFYTDIPLSRIEEKTGEAPYFEKMVIWFAFVTAPAALLASFVLSVIAFQWWAVLAIPISVLVYFIFSGQSSMPGGGMLGFSILLAIAIGTLFTSFFASPLAPWYFIAVTFSLWASRLLYTAATAFLRGFVLRNQRALEFMGEQIHIREA
jgi:hypothetical protein